MKTRAIVVIASVGLLMAGLASCSSNGTQAGGTASQPSGTNQATGTGQPAGDGSITIGVSMKTLQDQFPRAISEAIQAKAKSLGVKVIVQDANADANKQLDQVENLLSQGVKALILNPQDTVALGSAVDSAKAAGVPVIEVNTSTTDSNYQVYVGSSDVEAGKIQGQFIADTLKGKGNVVMMYGAMGQSGQIQREQGVDQIFKNYPNIKVVDRQTADWQRDKALTLAENWLNKYPDLQAIMAQNDDEALGAYEAVKAAGRQNDVRVVGVDAISDALTSISNGEILATVFQDAKGQGENALDAAVKIAKGETVDKQILIPFKLVTKENVADFK